MKILINCSNLKKGGGLQVAHSFINEINHFKKHEFIVLASNALVNQLEVEKLKKNIQVLYHDTKAGFYGALTGKEKTLSAIEKKINPDIVFTVFGPSYWKPKAKHLAGFAKGHYIYADSPYFTKINNSKKTKIRIKRFLHLFDLKHFNDAIVTESKNVSDRVKLLFPTKPVFTVSNTYNQVFDHPEDWDYSIKLPVYDGITLLTISANYPHKNLDVIPLVIDRLKTKYPDFEFRFVITLNQEHLKGLKEEYLKNILFIGKVSINQCPFLYQQADFMFLPTLLECFSASYPEAMRMETPILTSDLPFARGICGKAANYFDPINPDKIAETIFNTSKDFDRVSNLKLEGKDQLTNFETSRSRAKKYIEILENLHETAHSKF